jgi:eukaryotic-like serine/threonine-protein kinase
MLIIAQSKHARRYCTAMAFDPPYERGGLIGEGATSLVYDGTSADGRAVALKVLNERHAADPVSRARFLREARAASAVRHPRLVPVLATGDDERGPWLAMPHAGTSLAATIARTGPLALASVARLAEDLGAALDALHAASITHRDLKPSNVLIDADGTARISDFGLARAADWTVLTRDGEVVGTPHYSAPELIEGAPASTATDVYALGCLLWEAASGTPPFTGRSVLEIGVAHLGEIPTPPGDWPRDLAFALGAPLAKRAADRPATGHALAALVRVAVVSSGRRA